MLYYLQINKNTKLDTHFLYNLNYGCPVLFPFAGNPRQDMPNGLPFKLTDYLELVDWTGRIIRDDKRGSIPDDVPPILEQLNIDPKHWCYLSQHFESQFKSLVGTAFNVKPACQQLGQQWVHGIRICQKVFPT